MSWGFCISTLEQAGFRKLGELRYRLPLSLFWNPHKRIQISNIALDEYNLAWATKSYYVVAIGEQGETYIRHLGNLYEDLRTHYSEAQIIFAYHRNVVPEQILKRIQDIRKSAGKSGFDLYEKQAELETIRTKFNAAKSELSEAEEFMAFANENDNLLNRLFANQRRNKRNELEILKAEGLGIQREVQYGQKLFNAYKEKTHGAGLVFSINSTLQLSSRNEDFRDSVSLAVKEIDDIHNFQIRQKLQGGKLNIFINEMQDPLLDLQLKLAGGVLSPTQLKAMGRPVQGLLEKVVELMPAWPSQDITVDSRTVDQKKLFGAKVLQVFFDKLEKRKNEFEKVFNVPKSGGYFGNLMVGSRVTETPFLYPPKSEHICITGPTGEGKTVAERVLVENIAILTDAKIIILEPPLQGSGIGLANTNTHMLKRLEKLGIRDRIQGFPVRIFTPGMSAGLPLPKDLEELLNGPERIVDISFKGTTDLERIQISTEICKFLYHYYKEKKETDQIRLFFVLEEAPSFMPENVDENVANRAKELRSWIIRNVQELRKYGFSSCFVAQSSSAFRRDAGEIRKNIRTWVYMRTTDRTELEKMPKDVAQIVSDLNVGEAVFSSPDFAPVRVYIRPSFSEIRELSSSEIQEINTRYQSVHPVPRSQPELNELEERSLELIRKSYSSGTILKAKELERKMGISGSTRQRLLDQLEKRGLIERVTMPREGIGRPAHGLIPIF